MSETPITSGGAVESDSVDLVSTKLHVPRPTPGLVDRPRLGTRLDEGFAGRVTLVCAPPGFGKSVLVADWCKRTGASTGWLSLDPADNDPTRFWRHLAGALDRARDGSHPPLLEAVERRMRGAMSSPSRAAAAAIVNAIAESAEDVVLVLDDYHVIEEQALHDSVRFLLDHAPPRLHVGLISRRDPPFALARARARGHLVELRAADLRFTEDEAASLLRQASVTDLTSDAVAALTKRTEGWAAGLQLAMLSIRGLDDVESFVATFSGSHRFVLDYLSEEVLSQQPAPLRDFLIETSLLTRLSGPLCDAVTGRTDSQSLLEQAERANLFLVPLDDVRGWWRYHHLFGDLLRLRLNQRPEELVQQLHRRAATWHDDEGLAEQAVQHALDAGDPDWATAIIERHADELLMRAEGATLLRWLAKLPRDLERSQRLLLAQARAAVYGGRVHDAEQLLDAAAEAAARETERPFEPTVGHAASPLAELGPMTSLLRAFVAHMRGDADEAETLARRALADIDDHSVLATIAQWHFATGPWLRGDVLTAEPALQANVAAWRAAGLHGRAAWSSHYLGRVQQARGDLDAARATYEQVLALDAPHTATDAPAAGIAHVGLAQVAYRRGDLEEARQHAVEGVARCRDVVDTQALATGLSILARTDLAEGDTAGAREAIDSALREGPGPQVVDLLSPAPTCRARLLLAEGALDAAADWAAERGLDHTDDGEHAREPAYVMLARILLAQERPDDALRLLDSLRAAAHDDDRIGSLIEIEALRALALAAAGHGDGAVAAAAHAVTLAARQRHVQVFVDEGPPMLELLGQIVGADDQEVAAVPLDFLADLAAAFDRGRDETEPGGPGQLVPLTDRELEVLDLVALGHTNQEIADDLFLSLNTVKTHVTHIFQKLGVGNRTAAADRARQLGLLA